jgi:uncharacterized membrane protein
MQTSRVIGIIREVNTQLLVKKNLSLFVIIIIALGLRLPFLNGSFWLDEAAQALESTRPLSQQLQIRDDFQPPLLHIWLHFWAGISTSEAWLRLGGALLPGIVTIAVVYLIAKGQYNERVAIFSSVLLSFSSFHVFYSQELRQYSLPAMWAALSWWWILRSKPDQKFDWQWVLGFGAFSTAGWYSSYLYPFLFLAQVVYVLIHQRQKLKELFLSCVLVGGSFFPWVPFFLDQLQAGRQLQTQLPGWSSVVGFSQLKSLGLIVGKFIFGVVSLQERWVVPVGALVLVGIGLSLALLLTQSRARSPKKTWLEIVQHLFAPLWLPICWLVIPIASAWVFSFIIPILQPKRVLYCLPAVFIGIAWLIDQVWKKSNAKRQTPRSLVGPLLFAFLVGVQAFSVYRYYTVPTYQREDWAGLYQQLSSEYSPVTSVAVFAFPEAFAPWRWYNQGFLPTYATKTLTMDTFTDEVGFKKLSEYDTIMIFDYLRDLSDPHRVIDQKVQQMGYVEVRRVVRPNIGYVIIFQRKSGTYASRN